MNFPLQSFRPYVLALLVCALSCASVSRADAPGAADLQAKATALGLAQDPQWLALLHVNRGGTTRDRGRSYVDDPRFFLAENGGDDAVAEMSATIAAMFSADAAVGDDSARCRFVARYRWLAARLGQAQMDPRQSCPGYAAWRQPINAGRVTLIFPGSYLNSPSSMFGHTLLRLDPPASTESTVWLSQAVSFGADVRKSDNSMLYIWKGLAGGYPGRFQVESYFTKIQHYGRMENRDLWEYPLDLTPEETAFLVDHLWEVQQTNFDYYFFDENCSYRLLELLEVARPSLTLTDAWRFSEAPVNTVRSLRDAGVAAAPTLRPSAERELRARIAGLDEAERDMALALVDDKAMLDNETFRGLPPERQSAVLATAYANIVYRARKQKGRDPVKAQHSLELLRALNTRNNNPAVVAVTPAPPESGHTTHRISLGGGVQARGSLDDGVRDGITSIGLRTTYHDMLDPVRGYLPGAELEVGDTELRIDDRGRLQLERFDVANVFSLSARDRFFRSWSWRVRGGIERQPLPDMQLHSTRHIEGGGGFAWRAGDVFARVYAEVRVEHSGVHDHLVDIAGGPALGLLGQHTHFNWQVDARPLFFGSGFVRTEAHAALQWQLHRDWGLRAEARWRESAAGMNDAEFTDAQLVLHRYF